MNVEFLREQMVYRNIFTFVEKSLFVSLFRNEKIECNSLKIYKKNVDGFAPAN